MTSSFSGFRRQDGGVGVRNVVAVIPISVAASSLARKIAADAGRWARATPHQMGTTQPGPTRSQTERTLIGTGRNPNVGAALVVDLGTEDIDGEAVADAIAASGKPVETLTIRNEGGLGAALDRGFEICMALNDTIEDARRESADVSELVFGVECGGSDATSGIASNPACGNACEQLVERGGTACFSETPEFIGAEHILADRCVDDDLADQLLAYVERREAMADLMNVDFRGAQPTPGNQEGGLTTIEEKSLGAVSKGGTMPIKGMARYAERLGVGEGLLLMDTPGYDVESVVGMVAGGAQIVAFTTGRGSTTGNPIAPVIKVTGNPKTWSRMSNNMDVNVSTVFDGESLSEAGERVFDELVAVADGKRTEAERRELQEFAINEIQSNEIAELGARP